MVNEGSSALFQADKHFTFRTEALVHLSDPVRHMTSNVGYGYEADILVWAKRIEWPKDFSYLFICKPPPRRKDLFYLCGGGEPLAAYWFDLRSEP
jgi:hypothetical protein